MTFPNWRNADEYPKPNDLTNSAWAWEFLRRNPEYQKDFIRFLDTHKTDAQPGAPESVSSFAASTKAAKKWGLNQLIDPSLSAREVRDLNNVAAFDDDTKFDDGTTWDDAGNTWIDGGFVGWKKNIRSHDVAVLNPDFASDTLEKLPPDIHYLSFNFLQPLKQQFATAEETLARLKKACGFADASTRDQKKLWPLYLRILDANNESKRHTIAKALFGKFNPSTVRRVSETLKPAERLRDGGYRALPSRDTTNTK